VLKCFWRRLKKEIRRCGDGVMHRLLTVTLSQCIHDLFGGYAIKSKAQEIGIDPGKMFLTTAIEDGLLGWFICTS
jgi:hypothetical protein